MIYSNHDNNNSRRGFGLYFRRLCRYVGRAITSQGRSEAANGKNLHVTCGNGSISTFSALITGAGKLMMLAVILCAATAANDASAVWFNSDWDYRVKVEINPTKVGSTTAISSFPVYLSLASMPASFWSNVQSDGDDIRVVESDETTETAFELVSISTASSTGELHFMADSLSTTSSSTFYIYYGNPSASAYVPTDTFGRDNLWSAFRGVWHLSTTTNAKGGGGLTNANVTYSTTSKIYNGAFYDSTSDKLSTSTGLTTYDFTRTSPFTFSAIVNKSSFSSSGVIIDHQPNSDPYDGYVWQMYNSGGSGKMRIQFGSDNDGTNSIYVDTTSAVISTNTWYYVWVVYSGSGSASGMTFYVNDASVADTDLINTLSGDPSNTAPLVIGNTNAPGVNFSGTIDEFRMYPGALSSSWIATTYNNHFNPSSFYQVFSQESEVAPEATTTPSTSIGGDAIFGGSTIIR